MTNNTKITKTKKTNTPRKQILSKKNNKIKDKLIPKTPIEICLVLLFITLLILVIFLGIKAAKLKKEAESKEEVDIVIPILDTATNNTFSVDLSEMAKEEIKEYKFKITNYKADNISKEDINYEIELINNCTAVSIKLYKDAEEQNLLVSDSNVYNIKNNKLTKTKKDSDTYYLIIRAKDEIKEKDNISIKITGIN